MTHADDHNALHELIGLGLPIDLTPSSVGHLAHHSLIAEASDLGLDLTPTEGEGGHAAATAALDGWLPYGPLTAPQAVRDATSPHAVVHPGGNPTVVNPGDDIAAKITAAGVDGTLWFTKGTYNLTSGVTALAGQTWVLESAAGYDRSASDSAVLDGGDNAFDLMVTTNGAGTTIRGGVFQNCGNASSASFSSAIFVGGEAAGGGCLIEDVIAKDNWNKGIANQTPDTVIRRCYMTNNGRYNINCTGGGFDFTGTIIENCRWSFGNSRLLDPGDAAGGCKFVHHPGIIIRDCWVHDNYGFGIWPDMPGLAIGLDGATVTGNVVETNRRTGIFIEGNNGGLVSRNYVLNNGWDPNPLSANDLIGATADNCVQISVTCADASRSAGGVRGLIERNLIDFDLTQSDAIGRALTLWSHSTHPNEMKNWDVLNNQFWLRTANNQRVGGKDNRSTGVELWDADCVYDYSDYRVDSLSNSKWRWGSGTGIGISKTWAEWQAFGHDANGFRTLI